MKGINLYTICIIIIILFCSYTVLIYPILVNPLYYGFVGVFTFISVIISYQKNFNDISVLGLCVFFLIFLAGISYVGFSFSNGLYYFFTALPVLSIFMLSRKDVLHVLERIKTVFSVLISISFALYLLDSIGISLPNSGVHNYLQYDYYNYYYIYIDVLRYEGKFCGFTFEPGYFSLLLVCLLLINNFDYKKKSTYLYIASLLCTLSLGGYLLGAIGFVLQKTISERRLTKEIKVFLVTLSILIVFVVVALNYHGGDNIIVEKVLARLVFDEGYGIVGYNRENTMAESMIDRYFYSDKVWMGIGYDGIKQFFDVDGFDACSWRVFVLSHGAFYTLTFFIMSFFYLFKTYIRVSLPLFVIYWLDFYQHGAIYSETLLLFLLYINAERPTVKISSKIY